MASWPEHSGACAAHRWGGEGGGRIEGLLVSTRGGSVAGPWASVKGERFRARKGRPLIKAQETGPFLTAFRLWLLHLSAILRYPRGEKAKFFFCSPTFQKAFEFLPPRLAKKSSSFTNYHLFPKRSRPALGSLTRALYRREKADRVCAQGERKRAARIHAAHSIPPPLPLTARNG